MKFGNLNEALATVAEQLNLNADDLIRFAAEDTIGGYNAVPDLCKWPMGSLWESEGKILYAVVRAIKPETVFEIGVYFAASTSHILAALNANEFGRLISVDLDGVQGAGPVGDLSRWEFHHTEATKFLNKTQLKAEIVFEDGFHEYTGTLDTLKSVQEICQPTYLLSHDAEHYRVGEAVKNAWKVLFGDNYHTLLVEPSDCGLAYRKEN